jgi:hypothetical protein
MASLHELRELPNEGDYFLSFEDLLEVIRDASIKHKFSFRVPHKDIKRARYRCTNKECPWTVNAHLNKENKNEVIIDKVISEHTCIGDTQSKRGAASCQEWIQKVIARHMDVKPTTPIREIQSMIRIQYAENVQYKVCQVARLGLQGGDLAAHRLSFELLPAYIELLRRKASRSHTHLEIDSRTNRFIRVFICPHQSRGSWLHLRRFIAADGTFLKGRFIQQLLLAVGIDANGNTLILAWAVVESENEDSWRYFFHHLITAIPEISEEPTVFISDRDKGLGAADDELGENIIRAICAQHLKDNFTIKFSRTLKPLFWRIARANSVARFDAIMEELRVVNPLAAQYLLNAQPEMWARAHFQGTRFGHDTSNVVESINKVLLIDRELPIVLLLNSLWNRIMDQRFKRLDLAINAHTAEKWTPWARGKLQEHRLLARTNTVAMSSDIEGLVRQVDNNVYTVNLDKKTCSCTVFQENGIPCGHAITTIFARPGRDLVFYMPEALTIATWKKTYTSNFPLIDITELLPLPLSECHPPLTRVPRGRPKKERFRREDTRGPRGEAAAQAMREPAGDGDAEVWVPYHCSSCGQRGHFSTTCRRPHM